MISKAFCSSVPRPRRIRHPLLLPRLAACPSVLKFQDTTPVLFAVPTLPWKSLLSRHTALQHLAFCSPPLSTPSNGFTCVFRTFRIAALLSIRHVSPFPALPARDTSTQRSRSLPPSLTCDSEYNQCLSVHSASQPLHVFAVRPTHVAQPFYFESTLRSLTTT